MDNQFTSAFVAVSANESEKKLLLQKLLKKILPILFIAYFFSFLDRVNIGYAKLQMQQSIGFTDAQYALAAGVFFIGYALFEIPSNVLMHKIGARKTLARIMILWGIASACTAFVSTATQLYALRLVLGIFEAGFFPGVILYLSFWFPSYMRGKVVSFFILATLAAPIIGGPISGLIMQNMNGIHGFAGWQWMFLIEAMPIALIGLYCLFYLNDHPKSSNWLSPSEKEMHLQIMSDDQKNFQDQAVDSDESHSLHSIWQCITDYRIYLLASLGFAAYCGSYGFNFWLPTMIKEMGITNVAEISLYAVIPFVLAAAGMLIVGKSSDKSAERKWHYIVSMLFGALMMLLAAYWDGDILSKLVILGLAGFGFSGGVVVAWSLPAAYLQGKTAPAGIAMVSTLATMSGLFAPWIIGFMRDLTGTNASALISIAVIMVIAAVIMLLFIPAKALYVSKQ